MAQGTKGTTEPVILGTFSVPTMSWGGAMILSYSRMPVGEINFIGEFHESRPQGWTCPFCHTRNRFPQCGSQLFLYIWEWRKQSLMELLTRHYADHITETNLPAELLQMLEP